MFIQTIQIISITTIAYLYLVTTTNYNMYLLNMKCLAIKKYFLTKIKQYIGNVGWVLNIKIIKMH